MSQTWSTKIQGIKTLGMHREIRFNDENMRLLLEKANLKDGERILEIGCGPGTFTRKLSNLLKDSPITGVDLDDNFIDHCNQLKTSKNLTYILGDALELPFEDGSFDVCSSHTVVEHLPNLDFLGEQYRVLKTDGKIVVMTINKDYIIGNSETIKPSTRLLDLFDKVEACLDTVDTGISVGKHSTNPQEILKSMELVGFKNLQLHFLTDVRCLDDDRHDQEYKELMIESQKQSQLEFIDMAMAIDSNTLTPDELMEMKGLIEEFFNHRLTMALEKNRLWDFSITPIIVMIGTK